MTSTVNVRHLRFLLWAVLVMLVAASCAPRDGDDIGSPVFNGTTPDGEIVEPPISTLPPPSVNAIRVPIDETSIQGAVNRAQPGDLILIEPGIYPEQVVVTVDDIVIRGRNRNTVFVDGTHSLTTGITVNASGVAVENLTVRNYLGDGIAVGGDVIPEPVDGFRAFHVTTSNTALNGIALRSVINAEVREGWHSGHGEAGVLVSGCQQCNTLVTTTLAEFSARGFSVVGALDSVSIHAVTARNNRAGIVVEDGEVGGSVGVTVSGSIIQNNGFSQSPLSQQALDFSFGVGIHVGGTSQSSIISNRITGNTAAAVLLSQNVTGTSPNPLAARVAANVITDNPTNDIVLAYRDGEADPDLCITNNGDAVITPSEAAEPSNCGGSGEPVPDFEWQVGSHTSIGYENGPLPPEINGMTDADVAGPTPAGPVQLPNPEDAVVPAG